MRLGAHLYLRIFRFREQASNHAAANTREIVRVFEVGIATALRAPERVHEISASIPWYDAYREQVKALAQRVTSR